MQEPAGDQELADSAVKNAASAAAASCPASVRGAVDHTRSTKHKGNRRPMTDEQLARARRLRCM